MSNYNLKVKRSLLELHTTESLEEIFIKHNSEKTLIFLLVEFFVLIVCLTDLPNFFTFLLLGTIISLLISLLWDVELKTKIQKRQLLLRLEFSEFANKVVLLLNSGMTISRCLEHIIVNSNKSTPLYTELRYTYFEIKNGKSEASALEDFGRRCKIKEIMKFTAVLISATTKGGEKIVPLLLQQSDESWQMRKRAALECGAKANVKLVFPLMLMLIAILLVVGAPAVIMINQI